MYSIIEKKIPNEYMSFRHLGEIKNGAEQRPDEKDEMWGNFYENYILKEDKGLTELIVEMDLVEEYADMFNNTFPKALQIIKNLSEGKTAS